MKENTIEVKNWFYYIKLSIYIRILSRELLSYIHKKKKKRKKKVERGKDTFYKLIINFIKMCNLFALENLKILKKMLKLAKSKKL